MTLVEFLLARIAEDEAVAQAFFAAERAMSADGEYDGHWVPAFRGQIKPSYDGGELCMEPARVLAECEAKRRMVALHTWSKSDGVLRTYGSDHDYALGILAAVYAGHPDFRDKWADTPG